MSVAMIDSWRLPGCGADCHPRRHNPHAHELWGLLLATLTPPTQIVRTGPLTIILDARRVTVNGDEIALSHLEWELLTYLAARLGRWCPADDILRDIWGVDVSRRIYILEKDGSRRAVDLRMLSIARHRLRRKLGAAARLIVTGLLSGATGCRLEREEPVP